MVARAAIASQSTGSRRARWADEAARKAILKPLGARPARAQMLALRMRRRMRWEMSAFEVVVSTDEGRCWWKLFW